VAAPWRHTARADAALTAELERMRDEIVETGHGLALPAVEAALAEIE
jgi:hypothetical protein